MKYGSHFLKNVFSLGILSICKFNFQTFKINGKAPPVPVERMG